MALVSFTSKKIWTSIPSISEFVEELSSTYKKPKYSIKVYYAHEVIFFALIERKLFMLIKSKQHNGWVIGFIHTSQVKKNYISIVLEAIS